MKKFPFLTSLEAFRLRFINKTKRSNNAVAIAIISFVTLLGAGTLAIDIGHQRYAGIALQNAADVSALAGAAALDGTERGITDAVNRALATLNTYEFDSPIAITRADIRFARNAADFEAGKHYSETEAKVNNREASIAYIRVKIPNQPIKTYFTHWFLRHDRLIVSCAAIAGISFTNSTPTAPTLASM